MPYRSAILSAIEDLKAHETGSPASAIRSRIKEHDTEYSSDDDDTTAWNETLFQTTLKSLVAKGTLTHINGVNYKFSDDYLRRRAQGLRARAESMEEHRRAAAAVHPREEPPKDLPKKKTVHAKVKLNEGKIITVVNPEGKRRGEEKMDTDEEDEILMDKNNEQHKKHVKIIPRKVGAKKMYVAVVAKTRRNILVELLFAGYAYYSKPCPNSHTTEFFYKMGVLSFAKLCRISDSM